jgi:hypothetical protein
MFQMSLARLMLIGIASSIYCVVATAELRQHKSKSPDDSPDFVSQSFTGANSRLTATQHACIRDLDTWQRVWRSHTGVMNDSTAQSAPSVDFSQSIVIAIVEEPDSKRSSLRITSTVSADETTWIEYQQIRDSKLEKKPRAENIYAFFVIPRCEHEIVLQRNSISRDDGSSQDRSLEVARFPALQAKQPARTRPSRSVEYGQMLNIAFAHDPGNGNYDGVVGSPNDLWNLVSLGTTAIDFIRNSDTTSSTARMRITRHDGEWGIEGQSGIFHGYIYDNCRCVDLEATILDLQAGNYLAYVYAHGDAPDQNAEIELIVGDVSIGKKATANDGTWQFRSHPFTEGVQYVVFEFGVDQGDDVKFISHRDGSDYSMFNAIQIVPINSKSDVDSPDVSKLRARRG